MIKKIFHLYNLIILVFYIYPGNLIDLVLYNNTSKGNQIFPSYIFSLDHLIGFLFLSSIGLISYSKNLKKIISYLVSVSIFLELFHFYIPNREFQISDIFANIVGVLIPIFAMMLFKFFNKK